MGNLREKEKQTRPSLIGNEKKNDSRLKETTDQRREVPAQDEHDNLEHKDKEQSIAAGK